MGNLNSMSVAITPEKLEFLTGQFPDNPSSVAKERVTTKMGWFSATLLTQRLGYSQQRLETLRRDLLDSLRYGIMTRIWINHWGERVNMEYVLNSPNDRSYKLISAWILRDDEDVPSLVTAIPKL